MYKEEIFCLRHEAESTYSCVVMKCTYAVLCNVCKNRKACIQAKKHSIPRVYNQQKQTLYVHVSSWRGWMVRPGFKSYSAQCYMYIHNVTQNRALYFMRFSSSTLSPPTLVSVTVAARGGRGKGEHETVWGCDTNVGVSGIKGSSSATCKLCWVSTGFSDAITVWPCHGYSYNVLVNNFLQEHLHTCTCSV